MDRLIEECAERSLALLVENSTTSGILAARRREHAEKRRYTSVFGRDAAICALAMASSGDAGLADCARAGLLTLAGRQAENGQIPKYVRPETGEADFWYSGCIDATLWWLIALKLCSPSLPGDLEAELMVERDRALAWLACQEHPVWRLLQQNEASDWADIMPRSGFVLYTNALWYLVKRLYGLPGREETRDYAAFLFHPFGSSVPEHRRARLLAHYVRRKAEKTPFWLSFVNFSYFGDEIDIFGNILALLTGLADISDGHKVVDGARRLGVDRPWPVRAVARPLTPSHPLWRLYMERHRQNFPYGYHNGGSWPFIGGFWVMLLARLGMEREAHEGLLRLAEANRVNDWEFNEWFHGLTGEPGGMPGQSWNGALFLLARRAAEGSFPWGL